LFDESPLRSAARLLATLGCFLLIPSCVQYPEAMDPAAVGSRTTGLVLAEITAPVLAGGHAELRRLQATVDFTPARLRQAYILAETGRPEAAVRLLNRTVFTGPRPSPATEAIALYLRGGAYDRLGAAERAHEDWARATALPLVDADLRSRLRAALARHAAPLATAPAAPLERGLLAFDRSDWQASPPVAARLEPMGAITRLTIHHSDSLCSAEESAVITHLRQIQRGHIQTRGWGDIGYHFLIDPAGRVWEGRELRYQGAHAQGANNHHNIGICLLGKFVRGAEGSEPTAAQVSSMEQLVVVLRRHFSIPTGGVHTHKELIHSTQCPGGRLQSIVDAMRDRHAQRGEGMATGRTGLPGGG
jgi:hypothetical protein